MSRVAFLATLVLVLAAASYVGAEEPSEPKGKTADPVAAGRDLLASLPAPAASAGFEATFDLLISGKRIGTMDVSARPADVDGKPGWVVAETVSAAGRTQKIEQRLNAALGSVGGTLTEVRGGEQTKHTWTWADGAYEVVREEKDATGEPKRIESESPALHGTAVVLLLGRFLPEHEAVYEFRLMLPDETSTLRSTLEVKGVIDTTISGESLHGLVLSVVREGREGAATVVLDAETRAFLGMNRPPIDVVAKGKGKALPTVDFSAAPKDAREAALHAALGFATGDADLIGSALHWPTLFREFQGAEGSEEEVAALRAQVIAMIPARSTRAEVEPVLLAALEELELEERDGETVVRFPKQVGGFELRTKEIDGRWYVVSVPGR
jgi:hypothetical protein